MFGTERKLKGVCLGIVGMMLLACLTMLIYCASEPSSAYTTRYTGIYIYNDSQFTSENGVTGGSGIESDPYIIEDWYIYVMPIGTCIEIINTQAHFVIRNCSLRGDSFSVGPNIVEFENVQNGTVENVIGSEMGSGSGIVARSSSNLTVTNNSLHGNGRGIYLSGCHDIAITDNDLTDNRDAGIVLASSQNILAQGNRINDNLDPTGYGGEGVTLTGCSGINVTSNIITGNSGVGLWEQSSSGVTISNNTLALNGWHRAGYPLTRNTSGIYMHESTHTNLSGNSLTGEGIYIYHASAEEYTTILLDTSNTVNGDPVRFFRDSVGVRCEGMPTGQLIVINCSDLKVSGIGIGPASVGVMIKHAADVEISDCHIYDNKFSGLELWDIANVTLSACNLSGNNRALSATEFTNLTVSSCEIHGYGNVYLTRGNHANVSGSIFENPFLRSGSGLSLSAVSHLFVSKNRISGHGVGVRSDGCDDVVIEENDVFDNEEGVFLSDCSEILVVDNNLTSNDLGLRLIYCSGGTVYHNNFQSNIYSQAPIYTNDDNRWNESYPVGGNYWSDYAGMDEHSGPSQDMLGADGIGDTPYSIYTGVDDHYPLMRPINVPNAIPVAFFTVEPLAGDVTTVFQVNASGSWDREDTIDVLEVRWDWGNDSVWDTVWSTDKTGQHQYAEEGEYTIRLEVMDSGLLTDSATRRVIVDEPPPIADAGTDQAVDEDTLVIFDGSGSTDNVGIVNYTWTFSDGTAKTLYGISPGYSFTTPGAYEIMLNVSDADGNHAEDNVTITVLDTTNPIADAGTDQTVEEGDSVEFDGSNSTDNTGILNYAWTFIDGTAKTLYGVSQTYAFEAPGTYTVTLNVTDAASNWDTDAVTITVNDTTMPLADAGPDQNVTEDTIVALDGSESTDNIGIANYSWSSIKIIDGVEVETFLMGEHTTIVFQHPGEYVVTLMVVDFAGLWDTDNVTIRVADITPPITDAGSNQTVDEDTPVTFDGSGSSDNMDIVNYTWTFTDGTEKTLYEVGPTYTFETPGTYPVTLNVSDTADNYATDTIIITVLEVNEPPVADAGANQTVTVGDVVTFNGSASTDDSGSIENYTWTYAYDGWARELYGVSPTFTFDIAGTYIVTLTVEDSEGETNTDTVTITVEEDEEEQEDGKSFIESYGLALGIVIALAIIALVMFFVLKGRKGGMAPTSIEKASAGDPVVPDGGLRS